MMTDTAQKQFSINDFFSKCDQIRRKLQIWLHLLKKSLVENFFTQLNCFWNGWPTKGSFFSSWVHVRDSYHRESATRRKNLGQDFKLCSGDNKYTTIQFRLHFTWLKAIILGAHCINRKGSQHKIKYWCNSIFNSIFRPQSSYSYQKREKKKRKLLHCFSIHSSKLVVYNSRILIKTESLGLFVTAAVRELTFTAQFFQ